MLNGFRNIVSVLFLLNFNWIYAHLPNDSLKTFGLVHYHLWEEDEQAWIKLGCHLNFVGNHHVLPMNLAGLKVQPNLLDLEITMQTLMHEPKYNRKITYDTLFQKVNKIVFNKYRALAPSQVIGVLKNGIWSFQKAKRVLYFVSNEEGKLKFLNSSDTLLWFKSQNKFYANGNLKVILHIANNEIIGQDVYTMQGVKILENAISKPKNYLLLFSGYRGPKKEDDPSDNLITNYDRFTYWYKLDNYFIDRIKPDKTLYLDGSFSIRTSEMKTRWKFMWHYVRWMTTRRERKAARLYKRYLNHLNTEGFNERVKEGVVAANVFKANFLPLDKKNNLDTLYIVSHSMGYAYSIGFLQNLNSNFVFGNYYALAPESGPSGAPDWSLFKACFQYGCQFSESGVKNLYKTDGIAPQFEAKGLSTANCKQKGRLYKPEDWVVDGFVDSHMVYGLYWIFETIKVNQLGYVQRVKG